MVQMTFHLGMFCRTARIFVCFSFVTIQNPLFYLSTGDLIRMIPSHCVLNSITEEITKTDDADLVHHPAGAHGESADPVSVQLP